MRKRISILGKKNSLLGWQMDLVEAFQTLGIDACFHSIQSDTLTERVEQIFKGRRQLENISTSKRVAKELKAFKPDLVIILNKGGLPENANQEWRDSLEKDTPIIGWFCDRLRKLPEGQKPNLDGLYYFDSSSKEPMQKAYSGTKARIQYLPLAASPKRFSFQSTPFESLRPELVFVGNCSEERKKKIQDYQAAGGKIDVYGPNSKNFGHTSRNRRYSPEEQATLYRTYFACFNPPQTVNTLDGLNLRAFEVPLSGGIGTYPKHADDLISCFEPGIEIIAYETLHELKEQIERLSKDRIRYLKIREAGYQRVMNEHTYIHRAQTILNDWIY